MVARVTEQKINRKATRVRIFGRHAYVALRMFTMQVLASELHFLTVRNAELAVPPLLWPVKNRGHVALLSGATSCLFPILCSSCYTVWGINYRAAQQCDMYPYFYAIDWPE